MPARSEVLSGAREGSGIFPVLMASLVLCVSLTVQGAIQFEEVSLDSGIDYQGASWGAAWGDFNGDGLPDIWTSNHVNQPALYLNQGDGTFRNISAEVVPEEMLVDDLIDAHGAAWADIDNDGDQDLVQLVGADLISFGGSNPNHMLINQFGILRDLSVELKLDFPDGRGRMPLWLDVDNDGWLDLYNPTKTATNAAPSALFRQTALGFSDVTEEVGLDTSSSRQFAVLADLIGDSDPDALFEDGKIFPYQVIETGNPGTPPGVPSLEVPGAIDVVIADLDGDLDNDVFAVRGDRNSDVVLAAPGTIEGHFGSLVGTERGISFGGQGLIDLDLTQLRQDWPVHTIKIGSAAWRPDRHRFQLSPDEVENHGIAPHIPGVSRGLYIGYDPENGSWRFLFSMPSPAQAKAFVITSTEPFTSLDAIGWDINGPAKLDRYFVNTGNGFEPVSEERGLLPSASALNVVSGDFDNDMDLDLYLVSTSPVQNLPNVLYENLGDGYFQQVESAGGAAGTVRGRGDAVAAADYDADGFLDLVVTNGNSRAPFHEDGPVELFHNKGNSNHWIELDLEGVVSNRNGIGARVLVTAGGVTQVREQNGGVHFRAQSHQRIHFGLGVNTLVSNITVHWPSGVTQVLENISADQILAIVENAQPVNKAPEVSALMDQAIDEDSSTGPLAFVVGDLESGPDTLTVSVRSGNQGLLPEENLQLVDNGSGNWSITAVPAENQHGGPAAVVLSVSDGQASSEISFNVTVMPVNDPPLAVDDAVVVIEGGSVDIDLTGNDRDSEGMLDPQTVVIVDEPDHGDYTLRSDGTVRYQVAAAGVSSDSMTYTVRDGEGVASNVATVSIAVVPAADGRGLSNSAKVALGLNPGAPGGDSDGDGATDADEVGNDAGNPRDSDSDGVIDALESGDDAFRADVAAGIPLASGDSKLSIVTSGAETLSGVVISPAIGGPDGVVFTYGVISYTTTSALAGTVKVGLTLSTDLPRNLVLYKVDHDGIFTELPRTLWTRVGNRTVELMLTDGDPLTDLDGVANGSIDDPVALGSVQPASTSGAIQADSGGGGGGGCTISKRGAAPMDPVLLILVLFPFISRMITRCRSSAYPTV